MKAICTICALALASSLLVVGADEKKKEADKKDVGTVIGIDLGTTYSWWVCDCTGRFPSLGHLSFCEQGISVANW